MMERESIAEDLVEEGMGKEEVDEMHEQMHQSLEFAHQMREELQHTVDNSAHPPEFPDMPEMAMEMEPMPENSPVVRR